MAVARQDGTRRALRIGALFTLGAVLVALLGAPAAEDEARAAPLSPRTTTRAFEWRAQVGGQASAVSLAGEHVLVAMGGRLLVMQAVLAAAPQLVAETAPFAGRVDDMVVSGGYAYLADASFGVHVVDVRDPLQPNQVGGLPLAGAPRRLAIDDGLLYVAAGAHGLVIVDLADPTRPKQLGHVPTTRATRSVALHEGLAYLAESDNWESIVRTVDVTDPAAPREVSFVDTPGGADEVALTDRFLYVLSVTARIWVLDITSDPAHPIRAGMTSLSGETPSQPGLPNTAPPALGMTLVDDFAYVVRGEGGLNVLDMRFPLRPIVVNTLDTPGQALDVVIRGRRGTAYLADGTGGLRVIDLRNRPELEETSAFGSPGDVRDIDVFKDYAAVIDASHGVRIIDLVDPDRPILRGDVPTTGIPRAVSIRPDRNPGSRGQVIVGEKPNVRYVRVGEVLQPRYSGGLVEVLPMELANPRQTAKLDGPSVVDMVADNRHLWAATDRSGTTPGSPQPTVGLQVFEYMPFRQVSALALTCDPRSIAGNAQIHIACGLQGLQIVSVDTPEAPELLATMSVSGRAVAVSALDDIVVVGGDSGLVLVVDVTDPTSPRSVGHVELSSAVTAIDTADAAGGPIAVVTDASGAVSLLDITDHQTPIVIDQYVVPGGVPANAIDINSNRAYVGAPGTVIVLGMVQVEITPTPTATLTPTATPTWTPTAAATPTPVAPVPQPLRLPLAYR